MRKNDLSGGQIMWLGVNMDAPCPHCNVLLRVTPDDLVYKMGYKSTVNGQTKTVAPKWLARCPFCEKQFEIKLGYEFHKGTDDE